MIRGKTYTFVVEGGHDPDVAAKYHPFYITDDSVGGYEYKNDDEKAVSEADFLPFIFFKVNRLYLMHLNGHENI